VTGVIGMAGGEPRPLGTLTALRAAAEAAEFLVTASREEAVKLPRRL